MDAKLNNSVVVKANHAPTRTVGSLDVCQNTNRTAIVNATLSKITPETINLLNFTASPLIV